jgi:hypothetical protein
MLLRTQKCLSFVFIIKSGCKILDNDVTDIFEQTSVEEDKVSLICLWN